MDSEQVNPFPSYFFGFEKERKRTYNGPEEKRIPLSRPRFLVKIKDAGTESEGESSPILDGFMRWHGHGGGPSSSA